MSNELSSITSKRIKELRLGKGYTMEVLAEKVGVSKSTIAKWENGYVDNMRQNRIARLAEIFNVPPTYIMGYEVDIDKLENETREQRFVNLYSQLTDDEKKLIDNMLTTLTSR